MTRRFCARKESGLWNSAGRMAFEGVKLTFLDIFTKNKKQPGRPASSIIQQKPRDESSFVPILVIFHLRGPSLARESTHSPIEFALIHDAAHSITPDARALSSLHRLPARSDHSSLSLFLERCSFDELLVRRLSIFTFSETHFSEEISEDACKK